MNQSQLPVEVCLELLSLVLSSSFGEEMLVGAKPNVLLISIVLSQDWSVAD